MGWTEEGGTKPMAQIQLKNDPCAGTLSGFSFWKAYQQAGSSRAVLCERPLHPERYWQHQRFSFRTVRLRRGNCKKIEYDKRENGYRLVPREIEQLSKVEVLALCKILLRAAVPLPKSRSKSSCKLSWTFVCIAEGKSRREWFISNELFNYHDPAHAIAVDPDNLWMVAQAIRKSVGDGNRVSKLKDHQIVKRTVEPVGLMFSEYYFYLMGIITDSSTRGGLSIKERSLSHHLSAW